MKQRDYNGHEVSLMTKTFPVVIEQDETGYFIVTCPILEGCYSQGKTLDEAISNIKEAIELALEDVDRDSLPKEGAIISQVVIP